MLFMDEAARHQYHQSSTLLQTICGVFEFECAKHGVQVELIGCENGLAALRAINISTPILQSICSEVSRQFKRTDDKYSCQISDAQLHFVECLDSGVSTLANLN